MENLVSLPSKMNSKNMINYQNTEYYEHIRAMADSICTGRKKFVRLVDTTGAAEKGRIRGGRRNVEASCVCGGCNSAVQQKTLLIAWAKQAGCYLGRALLMQM
ncbi:MAG: hypothetical protein LBS63_04320 [Prevotellaceae bacterium]|nr:hypothetical protein [Prevotellaceae bacterium]